MQNPTDQAQVEAPIPVETVSNGEDMNGTVAVRRKAAKRTFPFDLTIEELNLVKKLRLEKHLTSTADEAAKKTASPDISVGLPPPAAVDDDDDDADADADPVSDTQPNAGATPPRKSTRQRQSPGYYAQLPQDEEIPAPARKKQRLEEPLPTTRDEAARKTASPDLSVGFSPPAADDDNDANADSVTDTQPNAGGSNRATRRIWTFEEDAELTRAVTNIPKKMYGKQYKTDWPAISELIPGRTNRQCNNRWKDVLDPSKGRANGRTGKWTAIEDSKLTDAVQTHGDKDWVAIAALVLGRTRNQCYQRWHDVLEPTTGRASGRKGKWTEDEDIKLKDAVQTHGDKDWLAISLLVPGRTKKQCYQRWHDALEPKFSRASGCIEGKWTAIENIKLKDAVQTYGGNDWVAISALVPGRTKSQCWHRWQDALKSGIDRASGRKGKWSAADDSQLKHAVQTHANKDWAAISLLVPGRTRSQCKSRWQVLRRSPERE
jgi:hypothetical protein